MLVRIRRCVENSRWEAEEVSGNAPKDLMKQRDHQGRLRYCISCFYPLRDIEGGQCPECGRAFDPSDPRTTSAHPSRILWRSLGYLWWCLALGMVGVSILAIVYTGLAYDMLFLWMLCVALVPFMFVLLVLTAIPPIQVRARARLLGVLAIAVLLSVAIFAWPLRITVMLHRSAMLAYVDDVNEGRVALDSGRFRIGYLVFLKAREYDGSIGFKTTGGAGGGTYLVLDDPTTRNVWVNTNWEVGLGGNWFFVYQD